MNYLDTQKRFLYNAEKAIKSLHIEQGDITHYSCDVIVCPDDQNLSGTGTVARAIRLAAGPLLNDAVKSLAGCSVGEVKATDGFELQAKTILHTVSPSWNNGVDFEEMNLAKCYDSVMRYALENGCKKIVMPSIGTGFHRFPKKRAAEIAIRTILYHLQNDLSLEATIVCSSIKSFEIYKHAFKKEIVQQFLSYYSPEAYVCNQLSYRNMSPYCYWMLELVNLESEPFDYFDYMDIIMPNKDVSKGLNFDQYYYLCSTECIKWDYRTCLAYIVYPQRKHYWGFGGDNYPHDEQCKLGGIRNVLLRMSELLSQN